MSGPRDAETGGAMGGDMAGGAAGDMAGGGPPAPSGPPRRPRLDDVAAAVGLSTASVSLVLRNAPGPSAATRQRVLEAAQRLGYRPDRAASLLAARRTRLLGVTVEVRSTFHAELVEDLQDAAEQVGYDLVLSAITRTRSEERAVETLLDSRCEGLIMLGPLAPAERLAALARQLPVVVVGRRLSRPGDVAVVRSADDEGVAQAVEHLAGLGHRDIAFVDGGRGMIATDRRRGYRLAMRRSGLAGGVRVLPGDHTEESGARSARMLLADRGATTAVVAFNDRCALGLLDTLSRAGVAVPAGMSVVGYDDSPSAQLAHVNLTTVSQEARQQAHAAVAAAAARLDGGVDLLAEVVITPRLVVRSTTGPPAERS